MNEPRALAWKMAAPVLHDFSVKILSQGINPAAVKAEIMAAHFCAYFNAQYPFSKTNVDALIRALSVPVIFMPRLKQRTQENCARGMWFFAEFNKFYILVDPSKQKASGMRTRPIGSLVLTLLHEIAEIIEDICFSLAPQRGRLSKQAREFWASHFAAMCMMPPERFRWHAACLALDLRQLTEFYGTTLASTARQVRDVLYPAQVYYFARGGFVYSPEIQCPSLLPVLKESMGGVCAKMFDVVRSKGLGRSRQRSGGLPLYNLSGSWEYRVMHPAIMRECVQNNQPLFIEKIEGAACLEPHYRYTDLFGMNRLSVLIYPYGYSRVKGFFMQAMDSDQASPLKEQAEAMHATIIGETDWLFARAYHQEKRKTVKASPDRRLPLFAPESGRGEAPFPWLPEEGNEFVARTLGSKFPEGED